MTLIVKAQGTIGQNFIVLTPSYSIIISTFTQEKDEMLTKASGREIQDTPNEKAGS